MLTAAILQSAAHRRPCSICWRFVIVGSAAALHRTGKTGWLVVWAAACALETIFRPYALLFWVFPLTAVWQHIKRRRVGLFAARRRPGSSLSTVSPWPSWRQPYFSDGGMDFDGMPSAYCRLHPDGGGPL